MAYNGKQHRAFVPSKCEGAGLFMNHYQEALNELAARQHACDTQYAKGLITLREKYDAIADIIAEADAVLGEAFRQGALVWEQK